MSRLRKAPPPHLNLAPKVQLQQQLGTSPSRTMVYAAQASTTTITSSSPSPRNLTYASPRNGHEELHQLASKGEHYWAARALTAETLLSASTVYQEQLRVMTDAGQNKHSQEMAELNRQHEVRHTKLERFAMLLMTWLLALVAVLIYLLVRGHPPQVTTSKWMGPLHFTVPVLSPFTSVTEHETSTLSTRSMVAMILAASCLAYACFTYWLRQQQQR